MKKSLLICVASLCMTPMAVALDYETFYTADGDSWQYGAARRVSQNGKYVIASDDYEYTGSVLANLENATEVLHNYDGEFMDVANDGTCVGQWYEVQGSGDNKVIYRRAAFFKDGKWTCLPSAPETYGQSWAVAITPDAKIIAGISRAYYKSTTTRARYYPTQWFLNEETGQYEVCCYNDLELPDNNGFWVLDQSIDGRYVVGQLYTTFGNTIPAMLDNGELKIWNKLTTEMTTWEYKGEVMGEYEQSFVDGLLEDSDDINGIFMAIDDMGYCYGMRTIITEVNEDHQGYYRTYATIYDTNTDTFKDYVGDMFLYGYGGNYVFDTAGKVMINGVRESVEKVWQFDHTCDYFGGIYYGDARGQVFSGANLWFNDVIGGYEEIGCYIKLDEPLFPDAPVYDPSTNSIAEVDNSNIVIEGGNGVINVYGAKNVNVYTIAGQLVGKNANTAVQPGLYVVKADNVVKKIVVK